MATLYTIGHSNQSQKTFLSLLHQHEIDVLVDVRSKPYSRFAPHFNQEELKCTIKLAEIKYLFMGEQLGGRPEGSEFYDKEGHVLYGCVAQSSSFRQGILRLESGISKYRVAIMCSEENPAICHRALLVGRVMAERGAEVSHIRGDGTILSEAALRQLQRAIQPKFFEPKENSWRSIHSVLQKRPPSSSLKSSSRQG